MTDEAEVLEPQEGQEQVEEQIEDSPEDVEAASKIGWAPKDRFRGDPEKWVPAKEFLKRGEEQLPLVKAELRRTQERLASLEKSAQAFAEHHKKTEELAYKRALEALREERAAAISELDGRRVNEIDDKIEELRNNRPSASNSQSQPAEFFNSWVSENPWVQDEDGQVIAEALAAKMARKHPELVGKREILDKVTEEARAKFPHLFPELSNQRRSQAASVASGGKVTTKAKKSFADLPAEAKDACRDFVRRGFMTEAEYVKDYFGEQA